MMVHLQRLQEHQQAVEQQFGPENFIVVVRGLLDEVPGVQCWHAWGRCTLNRQFLKVILVDRKDFAHFKIFLLQFKHQKYPRLAVLPNLSGLSPPQTFRTSHVQLRYMKHAETLLADSEHICVT